MSPLDSVRCLIVSKALDELDDVIWFTKLGVGYYPVSDEDAKETYVDSYFDKFEQYETTAMGQEITRKRIEFVDSIHDGKVVDVGIGSGHFIKNRPDTWGYDVSDYGKKFLKERNLFHNPYLVHPQAITCWDSFEHIRNCWALVTSVTKYVFMSVPITGSGDGVLFSKHFKPKEHYWYFTRVGLIECFRQMGFKLISSGWFETECGRESIGTYAFERV